ncbi:MAG: hypothetical protein A2Y84_01395 [Candidatus Colwellbacteria bacterium RBG_13_48_8]|uniref:Uncharacterized protein n=1 Tax=Candidatus Colwellbacteria bacterium RBG_13_48_8 TaxID=1797685 RepID=A0A1G1YWX2_9BACT|nr:MAG: hypothetical protein A2Y84_01395 [Candidatus Colwellbacteria bacterium RBG_13_48_8]
MQKKILLGLVVVLALGAGYWACNRYSLNQVNDFASCSGAWGSLILESYPEQCRTRDGRTFPNTSQIAVEPESAASNITYEEALVIAQDSECTKKGELVDDYLYNSNTKTWWIGLEVGEKFAQEGCSPACVVSEETQTAEINWRCTGLIPEEVEKVEIE